MLLKKRNKLIVKSRQQRNLRNKPGIKIKEVNTLSVGYVNIGLRGLSLRSLQECAIFAERDNLDFLFCSEVKLQEGDTSFSRAIEGFETHEFLRATGNAGGLLLLVKDGGDKLYNVWDGDLTDQQSWMSSERVWLRVETNDQKLAFCGTYLRTNCVKYYDKNQALLNQIEHEKSLLSSLGWTCSVIGDLNSHVGSKGPYGIPGNPHGTNTNGTKLINFMNSCNLSILNNSRWIKADGSLGYCSGLITFFARNSLSILDYCLFPSDKLDLIEDFQILDRGQSGLDTDHAPIVVRVKSAGIDTVPETVTVRQSGLVFPNNANWGAFQEYWDSKGDASVDEGLPLDVQSDRIISDMMAACHSTIPQRSMGYNKPHKRRISIPKKIRDAIDYRKVCLSQLRGFVLDHSPGGVRANMSVNDKLVLETMTAEYVAAVDSLKLVERQHHSALSRKLKESLRRRDKNASKLFWRSIKGEKSPPVSINMAVSYTHLTLPTKA